MKINKEAMAGSLQSNDCLITVKPAAKATISLDSPVAYEFGDYINALVRQTLHELNLEEVEVAIEDKGALDCTIKARLLTAIRRAE